MHFLGPPGPPADPPGAPFWTPLAGAPKPPPGRASGGVCQGNSGPSRPQFPLQTGLFGLPPPGEVDVERVNDGSRLQGASLGPPSATLRFTVQMYWGNATAT
jgi:hypothetical protein